MGILDNLEAYIDIDEIDNAWDGSDLELSKQNPHIDQEQIIYTYSFLCKQDSSTMLLELSKELDYLPQCLKCNKTMILRYSIDDNGSIWMNSAIMHE